MLKRKIDVLKKELIRLHPKKQEFIRSTANRKYTLDDWTIEDIRSIVFPEGRDVFDSNNQKLWNKWNETDWLTRSFLKLFSIDESKRLRDWMMKEKRKRGLESLKDGRRW